MIIKLIISVILIDCLLENVFKLHIKGSQGVDCLLKGRSSFPTITVRVTWKFCFCSIGMDDIRFLLLYLKLACQLHVNVNFKRRGFGETVGSHGQNLHGGKKAFLKLKSETIVIGCNSDLKLRATKTLI